MSVVHELKVFLSRGSAPSLIRHATVTIGLVSEQLDGGHCVCACVCV